MITMITTLYYGNRYVERLTSMAEENARKLHARHPSEKMEYILINDSPKEEVKLPESRELAVVLIKNDENLGIHAAKLKALSAAKGEFVFFLDQDDVIAQDCILSHFEVMKKSGPAVTVSNGYRDYGVRKEKLYRRMLVKKMVTHKWWYLYGTDLIFTMGQCMLQKNAIPSYWKKQVLKTNGSDDFYLWLCLFAEGAKFQYVDKMLYTHMETNENYSNNSENMDNSFEAMCDLLSRNASVADKEIAVLRRRLAFKRLCQDKNVSKERKMLETLKNIPIVAAVALYKIGGYY